MKKNTIHSNKNPIPDEVYDLGLITIARFGNKTLMKNNSSMDELLDLKKKHAEYYPELVKEINESIILIREFIKRYDPIQILYLNYFNFLISNSEIQSEHQLSEEQIISLRMIDYIQSVIAATPIRENPSKITPDNIEELKNIVTKLYKNLSLPYLLCRSGYEKANNSNYDYDNDKLFVQFFAEWVSIRGKRYIVHNIPYLQDLLSPHEEIFQELFNLTVKEFLSGLTEIQHLLTTGFQESREHFQTVFSKVYPYISEEYESRERTFQILKKIFDGDKELTELFKNTLGKVFGLELFDVRKNTNWPDKFIRMLSYEPGEELEFFSEGDYKGWPLRIQPIKKRPFLFIDDSYYCFDYINLMDNIYRIMQKLILNLKPSYQEEWNRKQKEISEKLPIQILAEILPGAVTFNSVYFRWFSSDNEKKDWQETDGIIIYDDHIIIIEVKAGAFTYTSPATDLTSYIESIKNLVLKPAKQTIKFINYLKSQDNVDLFNKDHQKVATIAFNNFRQITACCVTVDSFTTIAAKAETLSSIGINITEYPVWVVSLDDLRIYKDIFNSPYVFLHYLEERQKAILSKSIILDDELDHLGLYFEHNYYSDYAEDFKNVEMRWDGYRKNIDIYYSNLYSKRAQAIIPSQKNIPPLYQSIIEIASKKYKKGYAAAISLLLSFNGDSRNGKDLEVNNLLKKQIEFKRPMPLNFFSDIPIVIFCRQQEFQYPDLDWITTYLYKTVLGTRKNKVLGIILDYHNCIIFDVEFLWIVSEDIPIDEIDKLKNGLTERYNSLRDMYLKMTGKNKIGRNDYCPCGSDKKFKNCHGFLI